MYTRAISVVYLLSSSWVCHRIFSYEKQEDPISIVLLLSITFAGIIAQELLSGSRKYTRPLASSGIIDGVVLVPLLLASFKPIVKDDNTSKNLTDLFWISCINSAHLLLDCSSWFKRNPLRLMTIILLDILSCYRISLFYESQLVFFAALVTYITIQQTAVNKLKNTFTIGEASILSNAVSLLMYIAVNTSIEGGVYEDQSYYYQHNVIVLALIQGSFLICTLTIPFLQHSKTPTDSSNKGIGYSAYFYGATVFTIFVIVAPWVSYIIGEHPVSWIVTDLLQVNNFILIAYWILCLAVLLPVIGRIQRSGVKNIVVRKCFHLLGLIMFVPAIWASPRFLSLGYAIAFAALIILELIKFGNVPPYGAALTKFMGTFIDTRDSGYFTVTHMYLLIGCATPLWLVSTLGWDNSTVSSFLPVYAGLLTLGVGDSAAAVIGTYYGRSKWPWPASSSRSFQGSAANIASVLLSVLLLSIAFGTEVNWIGVIVAVTLSACLEALTDQIDNIILPLLFVALLNAASN